MSSSARVTSIEALDQLRTGMADVDHQLRDVLIQLDLELRRAMEWIEQEMTIYWPNQVRKASDRLLEAKNELERCQLRVGADERPACYEQKKAVEKAVRRLHLCESKVRDVRKWKIKLRQEIKETESGLGSIANFLDADIPRALASLERQLLALRQYSELSGGAG